jgi:uncharacterized DUF497 family protein
MQLLDIAPVGAGADFGEDGAPRLRFLFVVHNEEDGLIRITSARPATPAERDLYEEA